MDNHYEDYDLSKVEVPVLMLHAKDDKLSAFEGVKPWTERIQDSISIEDKNLIEHIKSFTKDIDKRTLDSYNESIGYQVFANLW